jgi:hypothetical protein
MVLSDAFKQIIIDVIKEDGSLEHNVYDWWTSFNDKDGNCYDVNVFGNEFGDCADDEVYVSLYNVVEQADGTWVTDYEGLDYASFIVKRDALS